LKEYHLKQEKRELENAIKVVAIMQTITEELDESGKKMWRKIFGIPEKGKPINPPSRKTES
jgi:hypothetical protein